MLRVAVIALLAGLPACTDYKPVAWRAKAIWPQAPATTARVVPSEAEATAPVRQAAGGPRLHRVRAGDSLAAIAELHGLSSASLARANGLGADAGIRVGTFLRIPETAAAPLPPALEAASPPPVTTRHAAPAAGQRVVMVTAAAAEAAVPAPAVARAVPSPSTAGFAWPVEGEVTSRFGEQPNGARNNGIDIAAAAGTAVRAAADGVVAYAGSGIAGYGNMLLVSHAGNLTTTYAYNRELRVQIGEAVTRGQEIATVGATGRLNTPQLHFEIREGKRPVDPLLYLTAAPTRVASSR